MGFELKQETMLVHGLFLVFLVEITSCQPTVDCSTVRCGRRFCPDGSLALIPPGQCCPDISLCRRTCGEIACILRVCEDGSVPPTPPGECCPDLSLCRRRCKERACILRVCNDGSVPPTPPGECCPDFSLCPKDNSAIRFGKY